MVDPVAPTRPSITLVCVGEEISSQQIEYNNSHYKVGLTPKSETDKPMINDSPRKHTCTEK